MKDTMIEWVCDAIKLFLGLLMCVSTFGMTLLTIAGFMVNLFLGILIIIIGCFVVTGLYKLFEWWDWTFC